MFLGLSFLIYSTIKGEEHGTGKRGGKLSAIKKIVLNFMQMISIVASLPLEWPESINIMFNTMSTISSAGTTLLIPDCELTEMRTIDAFYLKQIFYTFLVPFIVLICLLGWYMVWICCGKCRKLSKYRVKDYTILTIVLMLFLCYPMLVKLCLSTLQCPKIGEKTYLMADLQEPCFEGTHVTYIWLLTVPQLILYVFGLPAIATFIVMRESAHRRLHSFSYRMRYGLLYMGYREDRYWWELVIAVRKVTIVGIGTFGTLMGRTDLQAYVSILVVFISIVIHLGKFKTTGVPLL